MATTDAFGNVFYDDGDTDIVDPQGNVIFSSDPMGSNPFGGAVADFVLYGVVNGTFSMGPSQGVGTSISSNNRMPYWTGPWVVSGNSIGVSQVADASSPSGKNLRFTVSAGAAGDEVYMEQIVPVGGSRWRWVAASGRATFIRVTASDNNFQGYIKGQYLDATLTPTAENFLAAGATFALSDGQVSRSTFDPSGLTAEVSANVSYLRIQIGIRRNSAAAAATGTFDVADVRRGAGFDILNLGDQDGSATYQPAAVYQNAGELRLVPAYGTGTTPSLGLQSGGDIKATFVNNLKSLTIAAGHLRVAEITAPGTPTSGLYAIYAKSTDSHLYGLNDGGTEVQLDGGAITASGYTASATNRILGRITAGAGAVEELTAANVKTILALAQADITGLTTGSSPTFVAVTLTNGQVVFPATQVASANANTLDDYAEGSWTPVVDFTTHGNLAVTYTTQVGSYTKIGNRVLIDCVIVTSAFTYTTSAGNLIVSGLPFTVGASAAFGGRVDGWTLAGYTQVSARPTAGQTYCDFPVSGSGQAGANLSTASVATGASVRIQVSGTYRV